MLSVRCAIVLSSLVVSGECDSILSLTIDCHWYHGLEIDWLFEQSPLNRSGCNIRGMYKMYSYYGRMQILIY